MSSADAEPSDAGARDAGARDAGSRDARAPDPLGPGPGGGEPDGTAGSEPLTRARILETALSVIEEEGIDGLTMRELARRLGCAPMSLYRHVSDRDQLVQLVVEEIASSLDVAAPGEHWREVITRTMTAIHARLGTYPGLAAHVLRAGVMTPALLGILETVVGALRRSGLGDEEVARAQAALWALALGSATLDEAVQGPGGEVGGAAGAQRLGEAMAGRAADAYPNLAAVLPEVTGLDRGDAWQYALQRLLDGIGG